MKTLLLVDDEPSLVRVTGLLLGTRYRVLTALNGLEALAILAREPVDLIVTDYRMPGMDGLELLRHVPDIPGVLTTAVGDDALWEAASQAGARVRIEKPWELEALFAAIEKGLASAE